MSETTAEYRRAMRHQYSKQGEDVSVVGILDELERAEGQLEAQRKEAMELLRQVNEAFRITREYVGKDTLPAIEGWAWYDADCAARTLLVSLEEHE